MVSERIKRHIDQLLDEADEAFAARAWERLRDICDSVLRLDPENEDARAFREAANRDGDQPAAASDGIAEAPSKPAPASPDGPGPAAVPDSFAAGRYLVRRFLGEGGKKRVFLAHDAMLDRDVAFALIKTEGLDFTGRERVVREAQAMGRLGSHPNIVSIFDIGQHENAPYVVTELMGGGDVEGLLEKDEGALPLERTLAIAMDVARGLEFAHGKQVVHRDLKPGNVWLTETGTAKIGDFGLAVSLDRSRLTQHGFMVGTVAYMPPEQALGGEVTPQADLYSLGAMLYEMVTGSPPFAGDATAIISQHINTPPVAPSWHSDRCPPPLETLILSLLEKDPRKRPDSASVVLQALAQIDPAEKSKGHTDSNVLDRLARGVFVGRERELDRLRKVFDEAFAGRGGVVMLVGEPGIGKTRTVLELETYARLRGAGVVWGRTHESAGAPPFWPWVQAGREYAAARDPAALREDLGQGASELVRLFPELRDLPGVGEPAAFDDAEVAQFRLFDAFRGFLAAASRRSPLVVVLDDLHWADRQTLKLLRHLSRELSHMRVLIAGTYRDTDLVRTHPLSETLAELNREGGFERVNLRGLTEPEVHAYIAAAAKVAPAPALVTRIYEETEGNPFFLSEMVKLMTEEGTLTRQSVSDIRLPEGVKEALGRRLDRLSAEANDVLQVAAVAGREFAYDTLSLVTGHDDDTLLRLLEEGLAARVIEEAGQAGRFSFTHALMQETLLEELSTTRRVRLHGRIGEAIEQRYGDRAREQAARLAEHFVESAALNRDHAARAVLYSRLAGEEALARLAWPEAASHYGNALELLEVAGGLPSLDEAALHEGLGRALVAMGGREGEAFRALRRAFRLCADAGAAERAFVVAQVIGASPVLGGAATEGLLREALALQPEGSTARARLEVALGHRLGLRGDDEEAMHLLASALEIAEALGDRRLELTVLGARATVDDFNGRDALAGHSRAAAIAEQIDDSQRASGSHFMAGMHHLWRMDLDGAEEHLARAREIAETTRQAYPIVSAAYGQALLRYHQGRLDDREPLDRALALGPSDARPILAAWLRARDAGDYAEAAEMSTRFEAVATAWRDNPILISMGAWLFAWGWWDSKDARLLELARDMAGRWKALPVRPALHAGFMTQAVALLVIASGDRAEMTACHERPDPPGAAAYFAQGALVRGLLDEALSRHDEALEHYEERMAEVAVSPTSWSQAAFERARLLTELGRPGAEEAVDEVLEVTTRIGMRRWQEKALALKKILKA